MKKSKLFVLVLGLVLCISVVGIGVFAVTYLKMNVTGQIDFVMYDKLVYIEQVEVKNYVETTDGGQTYNLKSRVLEGYNGRYLSSSGDITSIDISGFSVLRGEDLTIEIKMKSLSSASLTIECAYTGVSDVVVTTSNTVLASNPEGKISTGVSSVFSIVVSSSNSGVVSLSSLNFNISFEDKLAGLEEKFGSVNVGSTSQVDYYYLTMGTYNGEPVKWRYVSADGKTPYDASKGRPASVRGYYILETEIVGYDKMMGYSKHNSTGYHTEAGYTDLWLNDYATSDLRDYLTRSNGGILSLLNISQDDEIYKAITPQSLESLYKNIFINEDWTDMDVVYSSSDIPEGIRGKFASLATHTNFSTGTDKFFAPSLKEMQDFELPYNWSYYPDEYDTSLLSFGHWLRGMLNNSIAVMMTNGEGVNSEIIAGITKQARPAFIIS